MGREKEAASIGFSNTSIHIDIHIGFKFDVWEICQTVLMQSKLSAVVIIWPETGKNNQHHLFQMVFWMLAIYHVIVYVVY